jgi:protein-disulfide isomerase
MKRYLPLFIIVAVAVITAGAGAMLYRAKMQPDAASAKGAPPQETDSGLKHVQGKADAPVTLEIYGDFQCPACATASVVINDLQRQYGDRLKVVFYQFPLSMHAHALQAALVAEAAGEQGRFWRMHDLLYRYQSIWSKVSNPAGLFLSYAQSIGLDLPRFKTDANSEQLRARIQAEGEAGVARGVKNTPTLFVNGDQVRGVFNEGNLKSMIDSALAARQKH